MYQAFYGLSSEPFGLDPKPVLSYNSKQHRRAMAYLQYGVSRNEGCFIIITGEIGSGKTLLLNSLVEGLAGTNVLVGRLVAETGATDILRTIGAAFGFRVKDVPKSELLITLEAFLISNTSKGKRCLLIVDEAQRLTSTALEELRMLSTFQFGNDALLQSVLVGQTEFREVLQRPEMKPFRQRVAATCHLGALDRADTQGYIEHKLRTAGSTGTPIFSSDVVDEIFKASQGIPKRIDSICDQLLRAGFLAGRRQFSASDVGKVVSELADEATTSGGDSCASRRDGIGQSETEAASAFSTAGPESSPNRVIFLSYRRQDSAGHAGRLHDKLVSHFGNTQVFMDVDNIAPGEDFAKTIQQHVLASQVFLLVIGPQWTTVRSRRGGVRLDDPNDFVRLEVVFALESGIPVIPVLVGGASMPTIEDLPEPMQPIVSRHAAELTDVRFHLDAERLIAVIRRKYLPQG